MVHMQLEVKLNANSIPSSTSLILNITSESFPHVLEKTVNSSSTHCFLDHSLIQKFKISTHSISFVPLKLFDSRTSVRATLERHGGYTVTRADRGENQGMNNQPKYNKGDLT